ncbi:MAG: glyoxalase superfamily protein [Roseovarius sp.]
MTRNLPTTAQAKIEAKRLRETLAAAGTLITHAQALEQIAHRHGYRDWNALHAAIANLPPAAWTPGGRVTGH